MGWESPTRTKEIQISETISGTEKKSTMEHIGWFTVQKKASRDIYNGVQIRLFGNSWTSVAFFWYTSQNSVQKIGRAIITTLPLLISQDRFRSDYGSTWLDSNKTWESPVRLTVCSQMANRKCFSKGSSWNAGKLRNPIQDRELYRIHIN